MPNEVVTRLVKFFQNKAGVYQESESINFFKPGVKTLEVCAERRIKKPDST